MEEQAFTFGGHCGRGIDISRTVNEVKLRYGRVSGRAIRDPADFEITISKRDAIKLATRLLAAAEE